MTLNKEWRNWFNQLAENMDLNCDKTESKKNKDRQDEEANKQSIHEDNTEQEEKDS